MSTLAKKPIRKIYYPDSDGEPMADNTLQYEWNSTIMWNLEYLFSAEEEVFVAGDHLIYPVEGTKLIRQAPDVYVAFGVVKGYRGSYKVWEERNIFPQVIFEVWSPGNRQGEMMGKKEFYEKYGAEEYYLVYPDSPPTVSGWVRKDDRFVEVPDMNGFVSPRLGVRFAAEKTADKLRLIGPDGREFRNPREIARDRDLAQRQLELERQRKEALAAKLRELGVDPDTV